MGVEGVQTDRALSVDIASRFTGPVATAAHVHAVDGGQRFDVRDGLLSHW